MTLTYSSGVITQANESGKSITAVATITGGIRVTVSAHGYSNGDFIQQTGTTDYNGAWIVSNIATNTYDIINQWYLNDSGNVVSLAFNVTRTGTAARGDKNPRNTLTGVTNLTVGNHRTTSIGTNRLKVNGALLIDPETDLLVCNRGNAGIEISGNGQLYLGRAQRVSGYNYNVPSLAYINTDNPNGWWGPGIEDQADGAIRTVGSNAAIYWYNCICLFKTGDKANGFQFTDSKIRIKDGICISGHGQASSGRDIISGFHSNNIAVSGLRMIGGEVLFGSNSASETFNGLIRESSVLGAFPNRVATFTLRDIDFGDKGNTIDVTVQTETVTNTFTTVINSESGNNMIMLGAENSSDARNQGTIHVTKEIGVSLIDDSGSAISGARVFIRDTNNSQRKNLNSVNDTADKTHEVTTIAGKTSTMSVVTGIVNVDGTNTRGTSNSGAYRIDFRGKNDSTSAAPSISDNTSEFDIAIKSYLHLNTLLTKALKGISKTTYETTLFDDVGITETTIATALAWTALNTGERIYDRSKGWAVSSGNMEYPSQAAIPVIAAGKTIDFGARALIINGVASPAYAVNTGTHVITIDAGSTLTAPSTGFNTLKTTHSSGVAIQDATVINGWTIDGDLFLNNANDLTNITITGDLHINTGADSTLDFSNVTVDGNVYNDATGNTLTINASNGSSLTAGDAGTGNGQTNIVNTVTFKFTLNPSLTSYEWRIYEVTAIGSMSGAVEKDGEETATADNQTYSYSYSSDQPIAVQIINQPDNDYEESVTYYTLGNSSQDVSILLKKDDNT